MNRWTQLDAILHVHVHWQPTTAQSLLNFKVIGQRSRSSGFLGCFVCTMRRLATSGQYLALILLSMCSFFVLWAVLSVPGPFCPAHVVFLLANKNAYIHTYTQAGGDGPPVPSKQSTEVPGQLLHPSLGCRQSTASEICQSSLPNCSAVSTKYIRPSGLRCWGSDGLELTTGQSPWSIALQQQF